MGACYCQLALNMRHVRAAMDCEAQSGNVLASEVAWVGLRGTGYMGAPAEGQAPGGQERACCCGAAATRNVITPIATGMPQTTSPLANALEGQSEHGHGCRRLNHSIACVTARESRV